MDEDTWGRINRPRRNLSLAPILEGALAFARDFGGHLATETMLVAGVNDGDRHLDLVARFLAELSPETAYLAIPTRPPAEDWVHPPDEARLVRAYGILSERVPRVEYLIGYEGDAFAASGDLEQDLLSITAVHPMRRDAVEVLLGRTGVSWGGRRAHGGRGAVAGAVLWRAYVLCPEPGPVRPRAGGVSVSACPRILRSLRSSPRDSAGAGSRAAWRKAAPAGPGQWRWGSERHRLAPSLAIPDRR